MEMELKMCNNAVIIKYYYCITLKNRLVIVMYYINNANKAYYQYIFWNGKKIEDGLELITTNFCGNLIL